MGCTNEIVSSITRVFVPEYIGLHRIFDRSLLAPTNPEQIRTCPPRPLRHRAPEILLPPATRFP